MTELETLLADLQKLTQIPGAVLDLETKVEDNRLDCKSHDNSLKVLRKRFDDLEARKYPHLEVKELQERLDTLELPTINPYGKFSYVLKNDSDGFADTSWENIIANGQDLQRPYYEKSEAHWQSAQGDSPSGEGWYGSTEMPVISIICEEPVYRFRNTARIPGRSRVTSPAHRGSVLRMLGSGNRVLRDNTPYGTQTDAPIGLYVEPSTVAPNGMHVRNFEQTIENVSVVGQNGTMPLYIACNAFNLLVQNANFQSHQGAKIVIKHGPILNADWYPVIQSESPVYLPDPVFKNLLIEGDHKTMRKACGILASGNNMIFQNINFYGCLHGIYAHGGQGRVVNGCTMHHGATADGRSWANKDEFVLCLASTRPDHNLDSVSDNAGCGAELVLPKGSRMGNTMGWHNAGEATL